MLNNTSAVLLRATFLTAVALGFTTGCERSADTARVAVEVGADRIAGGAPDEAVTELKPVADGTGITTLNAKFTLGHAYLDQARDKATALESVYVEISRLQSEIGQLVSVVSLGNTMVDGYKLQDPTAARENIRTRIAEAQGGPDKAVWVNTGKLPLPTLSAARQNVSGLQAKVAEKQEQIRKLESDRTAALKNADDLAAAVDSKKGREAVEAFSKASNARKQVSLISASIEVAQSELARLNRDLSIAQGQLAVVEKFISELQAQDKALAAGFESVTGEITTQQNVSRATVSETGDNARSVASKSTQLAAKWEEANKLFTEAEQLYTESLAAYKAAEDEATNLRTTLSSKIENYGGKSSYNEGLLKNLRDITWPAVYKIQRGYVVSSLADLHATRARIAGQQEALLAAATPSFQKAGAAAPAQLTAPSVSAKAARDAALKHFEEAFSELEGASNSIQSDPLKRRPAATIAQIFALYSWAQTLEAAGNSAEAAKKMSQATSLRDGLISEGNGKLPVAFPGPLAVLPPPAAPAAETPAPATEPATPATPPTEPGTPAPATPGAEPTTPAPGR